MNARVLASVAAVLFASAAAAQSPSARRLADGGDLDKIVWERPFARARGLAETRNRVLLVKPILGGSNTPRPSGVPCGGKNDCEGSW
jgi:hypothetical protein